MINDIFKQKSKKISKKPKTFIQIDFREKNSLAPSFLIKNNFEIKFKELKVGDYLIGETIIERKEANDFIQSIFNKRIFKQMEEIKQYKNYLLIIEGKLPENNITKGTLLSIALKNKIPILFAKNPEETANYLTLIANKSSKQTSLNPTKKTFSQNKQLQFIIESFPNIGPTKAKLLLKKFSSIKNIIQRKEEELKPILKSNTFDFIKIINTKYS